MEQEPIVNQQAYYDALSYYGLLTDLKIVEDEMRKNEPLPTNNTNARLKNFWNKNVINETRRMTMNKLSEKKSRILDQLDKYRKKCDQSGGDYSFCENKDELIKRTNEVFCGENAAISKALFSIRFCLDSEINYENREAVLAEISNLLFGNRNTIDVLYKDLKENYVRLFKAPIVKAQKTILKCLGVAALVAVALPPLVAGTTVVTALTVPALLDGILLEIGIGVAATAEMAAIYSSILLSGMLIGTEIAKQIKVQNAKENLRKTSPEDLCLLLAIKATLIQYAQKTVGAEEMKVMLDDCLKQLNDLRSDAEYLLIVERLDAGKSNKKIEICNNFTALLANIVGL